MTDNIVSLNGAPVAGEQMQPSQYLIETLEEMLERAKNGQTIGMAAVMMEHDGQCPYALVGRVGGFVMAGSLSTLMYVMNVQNASDA
jgi:peptide deformylase